MADRGSNFILEIVFDGVTLCCPGTFISPGGLSPTSATSILAEVNETLLCPRDVRQRIPSECHKLQDAKQYHEDRPWTVLNVGDGGHDDGEDHHGEEHQHSAPPVFIEHLLELSPWTFEEEGRDDGS